VATSGIEKSGREDVIRNAILIAGPTASGKSRLALDLAARFGGVVVNADSMQVYSDLEILTARPGKDDLARVPHLLYGHVPPSVAYSTGAWVRNVQALVEAGMLTEKRPIFVGGTGLYFRALEHGLAQMPDIPEAVRSHWRAEHPAKGASALHAILAARDPAAAAMLKPGDSQRIIRALEVIDASGRSIVDWQTEGAVPLIDRASSRFIVLEPDRAELTSRIDLRFDRMVEQGGMEEARRVLSLGLDPLLPAMKAIGLREFGAALAGELSVEDATERAKIATRQYAKRQSTWFRNQLGQHWLRVARADVEVLREL
jgi:tRNA dimethylallyltransferase